MKSKASNFIETALPAMDMEWQIWEYIDGQCGPEDAARIHRLINQDTVWKSKHEELSAFHLAMPDAGDLEHTSMRFSQNVIDQIAHEKIVPATRSYINKKVLWAIASSFILIATAMFVFILRDIHWQKATVSLRSISFPEIEITGIFNNTKAVFTSISVLVVFLGLCYYDNFIRRKPAIKHS